MLRYDYNKGYVMNYNKFFINGNWVEPNSKDTLPVINPANEEVICDISLGNKFDLDNAVNSARKAFISYSNSSKEDRISILDRIISSYKKRMDELSKAITIEMGAPKTLSEKAQVPSGLGHFMKAKKILENFSFEKEVNSSIVLKEPVGVCGLITPWNWPLNQIACKVAPALAAGCTMILKPSEEAPLSAIILAEIIEESKLPEGVFNLINGNGSELGVSMSKHPGIDMMSFTGSTRAGISVAKNSADTVKRVTQELGGKSANIILDDVDFTKTVAKGIFHCMNNTGQSCNAPTRMLIPADKMDEAINISKETVLKLKVGDPQDESISIGPVVNKTQFLKIKEYISKGVEEGATLVTGGEDNINENAKGYFINPTIFANVTKDMTIFKEEIFGPVLSIISYDSEEEAIDIANDSMYGLSGYIASNNTDKAKQFASKLRTGMVHINYAPVDQSLPFGGYKMSGNGREWGEYGIEDFLETKAIIGIKSNS
tara:strand:- start:426 stop:1889 length:1464 start_codon:yes stop_codon:yes gene_type:complete